MSQQNLPLENRRLVSMIDYPNNDFTFTERIGHKTGEKSLLDFCRNQIPKPPMHLSDSDFQEQYLVGDSIDSFETYVAVLGNFMRNSFKSTTSGNSHFEAENDPLVSGFPQGNYDYLQKRLSEGIEFKTIFQRGSELYNRDALVVNGKEKTLELYVQAQDSQGRANMIGNLIMNEAFEGVDTISFEYQQSKGRNVLPLSFVSEIHIETQMEKDGSNFITFSREAPEGKKTYQPRRFFSM